MTNQMIEEDKMESVHATKSFWQKEDLLDILENNCIRGFKIQKKVMNRSSLKEIANRISTKRIKLEVIDIE